MKYPKVTIVGAGHVGSTTAFILATGRTADVVLLDVAEGLPQGTALDIMHSRWIDRSPVTVVGSNSYEASAGSDVVVVTAGLPRKPGMTRDELLAANARIVRAVVDQAVAASPEAVLLCVTNPLDVMTQFAWNLSGFPASRVLGMGGMLDSARFAHFIAEETGAAMADVEATVVGAHGDAMVPLPRLSTVSGRPLTELLPPDRIEELVRRTIFGGAEVVSLLKTGSAYYAPAASVAAMVGSIVSDRMSVMPSSVLLQGEYGLHDVYVSVPAMLGHAGVVDIPELPLEPVEFAALRESASSVSEAYAALMAAG